MRWVTHNSFNGTNQIFEPEEGTHCFWVGDMDCTSDVCRVNHYSRHKVNTLAWAYTSDSTESKRHAPGRTSTKRGHSTFTRQH